LLRQNIEAVHRTADLLHSSRDHLAHQHRLFQQIGLSSRHESAFAFLADDVTSPSDALQRPRDVARRGHLAHQVHRAHVDAQFQRRRRAHRRQPAFLEG
jgi:hypothetical protein